MTDRKLPPDPEALLAHSSWVRALARSLVADPATAEDVEQETWRRALQAPPRHARNLRGWLATVVRSVAAQQGRTEGRASTRRERFERASDSRTGAGPRQQPPSTPSEIAERMETFQALAESIGQLKEPYASAIYLRFVEELSVPEVAERQGVPVPTAATRIRRGLELLRGTMHERFGSTWRARCLVFAPPAAGAAVPPLVTGALAMTTKTKLLTAAAIALVAIPLYSVLTAPGSDQDRSIDGSPVEVKLPEAALTQPAEEIEASAPEGRSEVDGASVAEAEQPDPRALQVVVRDASTLEPVPGARVLYFDRASEKDRAWGIDQFSRWEDLETLLERYGDVYQTDGQGRVTLPPRASYAYIGARSADDWASTYLFEDPNTDGGTEVELLLRPSVSFEVLVEDELGRPVANQRVEYQEVYNAAYAEWRTPAMTDEQGIAQLRNLQDRLAEARPDHVQRIAVPIPGGVVAHEFKATEPPQGRITLRIPSTGVVRVQVRHADGSPMKDGRPVQLQEYRASDGESPFPRRNALRGHNVAWIENGEAVFPRVALNTQFIAWIQGSGQRDSVEVIGMGPVSPGGEAVLQLGAPPKPTVVALEVQDHRGEAVRNATFEMDQVVIAEGRPLDPIGSRSGTNDQGVLQMLQERMLDETGPAPAGATASVVLVQVNEGLARWSVKEWPIFTAEGSQSAGVAVLGEERIATGQVLNADGSGAAFAELDLRIPAPWPGVEEHQIWMNFKADEEGRFEVRGTGLQAGEVMHGYVSPASVGRASSSASTAIELIVGQERQRFELQAKATIAGRVLVAPEVPVDALQLVIEVTPMGGETVEQWLELDAENGRFERTGLESGAAQLVLMGTARLELFRSDWFELQAGEPIVPPGCDPLDMRGRIYSHRLEFVGPDGERPETVGLMFPGHGMGVGARGITTLLTLQAQVQVKIDAKGYRSLPERVVAGDEVIALRKGIPVTFSLPEGVKLDDQEWQLHLRQSTPGSASSRQLEQAEKGVARWQTELPAAGEWMLGLTRKWDRSDPNQAPPQPVLWPSGGPFTVLTIEDDGEAVRVTLEVTQEAIDAASF